MNPTLNRTQIIVILIFAFAIIIAALFYLGTIQTRGFHRLKNRAASMRQSQIASS